MLLLPQGHKTMAAQRLKTEAHNQRFAHCLKANLVGNKFCSSFELKHFWSHLVMLKSARKGKNTCRRCQTARQQTSLCLMSNLKWVHVKPKTWTIPTPATRSVQTCVFHRTRNYDGNLAAVPTSHMSPTSFCPMLCLIYDVLPHL